MSSLVPHKPQIEFAEPFRHISLDELVGGLRSYDSMPVLVQEGLRRSVVLTLASDLISIPLLLGASAVLPSLYPVESFFFIFTSGAIDGVLGLGDWLSGKLMVLNLVSLILIIIVMVASRAMTRPINEKFHWAAAAAAVPTGLSIISSAIVIALLLAVVILTLGIWYLIIRVTIVFLRAYSKAVEAEKK
jgi:hypothetical protein